jgi:DNA-binding transcriptional MerR regulator
MQPILLSLPDNLVDWRGTAAALADKCNELLAGAPSLADDAGSANERLVRHYVQVGVLTPPEREGREALFGLRQIVEFLAARYLLKDGWPLAKAAEIVRAMDVNGLAQLIPSERPRTRAEEVVERFRAGPGVAEPRMSSDEPSARARASSAIDQHGSAPIDRRASAPRGQYASREAIHSSDASQLQPAPPRPESSLSTRGAGVQGTRDDSLPGMEHAARGNHAESASHEFQLTPDPPPSATRRPAVQHVMRLETPLALAADISRRRVSLEENLKALGNPEGRADRSRIIRIELTPWCHVDVDARQLNEMSEETPGILGAALTEALLEERIQKGK